MSIPNILSISRILLVPVFAVTFFTMPDKSYLPAGLLLLSGVTDFLDGFIARRYHQITQLGKILDPFADKLTQLTVCVCLAIRHKEFIIILCLLTAKEIIMVTVGYRLLRRGYRLPSSRWFGKSATVVFYLVMIYAVYSTVLSSERLGVLVGITAGFAVLAFVMYIPEFFKLKRTQAGGKKSCAEIIKSSVKREDNPDTLMKQGEQG